MPLKQNTIKRGGGCLLKTIIIGASLIVVTAVIILLSSAWLADTEESFMKMQYPKQYSDIVSRCSAEYNVDEDLIYSVIRTESHFNETAVSSVGAKGLMQLMPSTFAWLQEKRGSEDLYTEDDLFDPEVNIEYGTYFLSILLNEYQADMSAVAAYNAGFVVTNWLNDPQCSADGVNLDSIPYEETSNYVKKVQAALKQYRDLY